MKKYILFLFSLLIACAPAVAQNEIISTFAGTGVGGYSGDGGLATVARLNIPHGITMDASGNFYIADKNNNVIRKVSNTGIITTIAGNGTSGYSGDGGPATAAQLNWPFEPVVDASGNVYFCDYSNVVRKVDATGIISTIAGTGAAGSSGDGGPATAATFDSPQGLAIDASGNLYVADFNNNKIRVINSTGTISTFAGTGSYGYSGDGGPATMGALAKPNFLTFDHAGNLYISDNDNHVIRKVNVAGIITTYAGNHVASFGGDGGPATGASLDFPCGVGVDALGNVYIADQLNNRIRMVDPTGIITTVVGTGAAGYSGDGGPATAATLNYPVFAYVSPAGDLYISDASNDAIRKVGMTPTYVTDSFSIYAADGCSGAQMTISPKHYTAGMSVKTFFGDGTSAISAIASGGYATFGHSYPFSGKYTIRHVLYRGASAIDSFHYSFTHKLCNSYTLKFYYDGNGNCVKDTNESFNFQPVLLEVDSNGVAIDTVSATSGLTCRAYGVPGDHYTFRVLSAPAGFSVSCPSTGSIAETISATLFSPPAQYVGMTCVTGSAYDLSVTAIIPVTGVNDEWGNIYVANAYCMPQNATITLNYTSKYPATPDQLYPPASSITSNAITWNVSSLSSAVTAPLSFHYSLWAGTTPLTVGDTVHSNFSITPTSGDVNPANNTAIIIDTVRAGCDPNEMWVSPSCLTTGDTSSLLQYTINFENTGNDTAFNIYVLDTLPDNVDPASMRLVMASNEMYTTRLKDPSGHSIIKFDFPGINLLDSSHHHSCDGAVIFTVNTIPGLSLGSQVQNRAGIYFDVNPVVMTNAVSTTIGCPPESVSTIRHEEKVSIFPNPATTELTIKSDPNNYSLITISNTLGETVLQQPLTIAVTKVDVSALPAGVYYVLLHGTDGNTVKKFVKM